MSQLDSAVLERIGAFVGARLAGSDAPGAVVGLTDREGPLGVVAWGLADADTGAPVRPETRFEIGSVSKSFAAIVALQEHEAGRLDLHAPVTEYVPWFSVRTSHGPITAHHLLTHTSGLIQGTDFAEDARAAVWALRDTVTGFAPGERFLYSNDGYKLLGLVLEAVAGQPARRLIGERVLHPLGMGATEARICLDTYLDLATGHRRLYDDRPPHPAQPLVKAPRFQSATADGSIVSTAADMAAYARMLLNRGAYPGGRLLSEESFVTLTSPVIEMPDEPGTAYGYGLDIGEIEGNAVLRHAGGMVGFEALMVCDMADGVAAVMMINGSGDRDETVRLALSAVRAARSGAGLPAVTEKDRAAVPDAAAYVGVFRSDDSAIEIVATSGHLVLRTGDLEVTLLPTDTRDVFVVPHPELDRYPLRFGRDGERVVEIFRGPTWYRGEGYAGPDRVDLPPGWSRQAGHYRTFNPWGPGFRVYVRKGRPYLEWPFESERDLVETEGGEFRVGEEFSPDRVRFDQEVEGRTLRAVYNGVAYYRTFTE